jgi:hypothetical protein
MLPRLPAMPATRAVALAAVLLGILLAALAGATAHAQDSARPDCFGAAARDGGSHCARAQRGTSVVPSPSEAPDSPNAPCAHVERTGFVSVCEFGVPASEATATFALVGDSHAGHWRAALDLVARAKGWRGLSITRTACPFTMATKNLPGARRAQCVSRNHELIPWFRAHPEVSMIFQGGLTGGKGVVVPAGHDKFAAAIRGYASAWKALPPSVRHVVVLRDTPKGDPRTLGCVQRAIDAHRAPAVACAAPRRGALDPDAAVVAARQFSPSFVRSIDMTSFFCGPRLCYPVIGGALAYRDAHHLTATFMATMAPYLLRRVDQILAAWR